jgi:hypothetical protein
MTERLASNFQLWRLNSIGAIRVVDFPDEELEPPLTSREAKAILIELADAGVWQPAKAVRGEERS